MSGTLKEIQELISERLMLTFSPDLLLNFDSEPDITSYIDSLDEKLAGHGVDGKRLQEEAVAERYNIKLPLNNVVEVEFPPKAS